MTNITVCSAAEEDYAESLCWYAERSIEAAHDFDAEFDRALLQIAATPERFPSCDDRHRYFLMRRFPFRYYLQDRQRGHRRHRSCTRITFTRLLGRSVAYEISTEKRTLPSFCEAG